MEFTLTLVDINPRMVAAWRSAFCDEPGVEIVHGSILQEPADAWVTPTNAHGSMDGGVDAVMKRYLGRGIEARVRREIDAQFAGTLPVGCAVCVPTAGLTVPRGGPQPAFLISAPTMAESSQDVSETDNVAWAFAAAVQAVRQQNAREPRSILSLASPGLGASTGRVSPTTCAEQMRCAYDLLCDRRFEDFAALRTGLLAHLCDTDGGAKPKPRGRRFFSVFG
jgi:O-acetyl-ADP-ribose deacetylase (regulator of RNase III)